MKKEQYQVTNLEQSSPSQPGWLFRLARPLAFLLGAALSLMAISKFVATAQMVIHDPMLVSPDPTLWTAAQLESALAGLRLPGNFYAVYSLGIALVWNLAFLACGWLILLRRGQDWFGLYLALLLLSWTNGIETFVSIPPIIPWFQTFEAYLTWLIWPGLFLLFYIFPTGHVTPRWARWFAWGLGLFIAYGWVITFLEIEPTSFLFVMPLIFAVMIVGGYTQVFRYRHAGALERQQIKWVVLALVLLATVFIIFSVLGNLTGLGDPRQSGLTSALIFQIISLTIGNLTFIGIPVAIALSVLRYRLWDIDVIVRKTLVYGALTATLALVFFGGVVLLQGMVGRVTGTGNSPVVIVISTLLIAAIFSSLRRRIQDFIDRRFYRQKYNAEQALADFAASARNETDLDSLTGKLVEVVQETMQPEKVTLWMKK
jgi:hypothetical protein